MYGRARMKILISQGIVSVVFVLEKEHTYNTTRRGSTMV